ncbi:glycosyltransferase family 2 protein [Rheinheimera pacifica]|uniref:glycosyltransferase family 2 protein n=1 Tax=Rheinheimera pacifica TaxID=173990 RepID=UPI002EDBACEA
MNTDNQSPKVGLVTVLYNGKEVLEGFFESLASQTYQNYKLYVIDNSPDDETLDLAIQLADKYNVPAEFVNNNANLGVAKGNNQGIELSLFSGCEYVLLLNNDIDFKENVIEEILRNAVERDASIVVPKIYYAGTNKIWQAGGGISRLTGIGYHVGEGHEDKGQFDVIRHYENSSTCFALIHESVFDKVGFMDEDYFVYYDDTDFFYRCFKRNIKICYIPTITINHRVSFSSGGADSPFSLRYGTRNLVIFFRKNMPLYSFAWYSFLLLSRIITVSLLKRRGLSISLKAFREGLIFKCR